MKMRWDIRQLGDLLEVQNGYAFDAKLFNPTEGMPLVRIRSLKAGVETETRYSGIYDNKYIVRRGDLLVGMDGEFGCYEWLGEPSLLNQRVCRLQNFSADLVPRFLLYGVNRYLKAIEDVTGYSTVKHLSSRQIKTIEFPVPPLSEQNRIVEILDKAFADIAKAKANAEQNLRNARELFESQLNEVFTKRGEGWEEKKLGDLVTRLTNGFVGPTRNIYQESGVPYLLARHVKNNRLVFDGKTFISNEFNRKNKKSMLKSGDVLLVQSGHIGHSAVVTEEHEGHNCHAMIVITALEGVFIGSFLSLFFNSSGMKQTFQKIRSGSTVPHLTCGEVRELMIPVPDLATQRRVVNHSLELDEETQRLTRIYQRKLEELEALKKSILHKAFSGEL